MSIHQNRLESAVPRWRYFAPTAILLILGVVVSVALFWAAYSWEMRSIRRSFDELAEDRCKEVSNEFQEVATLLDFTDNVFQIRPRVTNSAFVGYLRYLTKLLEEDRHRHPEICSLMWAPRVPVAERSVYEQAARAAFDSQFQIGKPDASGNTEPAAQLSEYFPIYLRVAEKPAHDNLGEDLALDPAAWKVMKQAQDYGVSLAIAPIKMSADAGGGLGYRIFQPLYNTDNPGDARERRQTNAGFLCLDLDVSRLIGKAMMHIQPEGIDFWVCDDTDGNSVTLCRHLSRLTSPSTAGDESRNELESSWSSEFFGRKVSIHCRSSMAFWAGRTIWQPWLVLCGGLALTLIGAGYQFNIAFHARAVERAVNKRIARLYKEIDQRHQADRLWDPNPSRPESTSGEVHGTVVATDTTDGDSEQ
jgi:CHASE1-domain containing sensor protein